MERKLFLPAHSNIDRCRRDGYLGMSRLPVHGRASLRRSVVSWLEQTMGTEIIVELPRPITEGMNVGHPKGPS